MSRKNVAIRLVAEGGQRVRAEFKGVGEEGQKAFQGIGREADLAGSVIRRVLGIVGAAFSVREVVRYADSWSDLSSRVALATGSQDAAAGVMERLSDIARRTYSSLEQTAESWILNNTALRELGLTTNETLDFTEALNNALVVSGAKAERAASVQNALSKAMAFGVLRGEELNTVIQSGGRVAELLAEELGVGVNQLRGLGTQGVITGAVIERALIGNLQKLRDEADSMPATIGDAFTLMRNAALQLVGRWDQLLGASEAVATALIALGDNLERVASIGLAFAAFMGGRWVVAFVAARVATMSLTGALVVLRGALIRTGLGALIVGAGELLYWFGRLVQSVGGFGAAMTLLGSVAAQAWNRVSLSVNAALARIEGRWAAGQAVIYDVMQSSADAVVDFGNGAVSTFQGAFDAMKAIWGALPSAIADFAYQAANTMVDGVEAMLNAVVARINKFIEGINAALALLPSWATGEGGLRIGTVGDVDLGGIENPFEGAAEAAGAAAGEAFKAALGRTYVDAPDLFGGMADAARGRADGYNEAAGMLANAAAQPMSAWQALRDAIAGSGAEAEDAGDRVTRSLGNVENAAGKAGGAARGAGRAAKEGADEAVTGWAAAGKSLRDYAKSAMDVGSQVGEALVGAFRGAEGALRSWLEGGKLNFRKFAASIIADLAMISIRANFLGPLANAIGGMFKPSGGGLLSGLIGAFKVPGFATGTNFAPGGLAWVGERGPELVNLPRGAQVFDSARSAKIAGGGGFVRIMIEEAPGFAARVRTEAEGVAVQVTRAGLQEYDRSVLPKSIQRATADPRRRG